MHTSAYCMKYWPLMDGLCIWYSKDASQLSDVPNVISPASVGTVRYGTIADEKVNCLVCTHTDAGSNLPLSTNYIMFISSYLPSILVVRVKQSFAVCVPVFMCTDSNFRTKLTLTIFDTLVHLHTVPCSMVKIRGQSSRSQNDKFRYDWLKSGSGVGKTSYGAVSEKQTWTWNCKYGKVTAS